WAAIIVSASQQPLSDLAGWTGTWRGRFVVRACTYVGWAGCYPEQADYVRPFTLTITDAGGMAGRLTLVSRVVPVTTLTIGTSLSLTGELSAPQSGGPEVTRIQEFSATSDQFGRLTGRFHYTV